MEEKRKFFPEPTLKNGVLGLQHLFAMFGATVLVPITIGLNPSVALFTAGLGTIIFHLITQKKVPVFLGSSFMFVPVIGAVVAEKGIPTAQGGIIVAGLFYGLFSLLVYLIGADRIRKLLPPIVTGPVIIVIGLTLVPTGISMASVSWPLAIIVLLTIIIVSIFTKGFFKLVPVLLGILIGYLAAVISDLAFNTSFIDFSSIASASWISPFWKFDGSFFTLPQFEISAILLIAPVAIVTFMEHIGDITTNGSVVGKDFFKDPGLHRTLLGDGVATLFAGLLGGPANTTYSENTGVLAVTKIYNPAILRLAAVFAIFLSLIGKFSAFLGSIPTGVLGGAMIILFGMIASIGIRTLAESNFDFSHSRNLIIVAMILVLGLGLGGGLSIFGVTISGTVLAVLTGVVLNLVLPDMDKPAKE